MSPLFKFKVKQDDKVVPLMVHADVISHLSQPLLAMMTGSTEEAKNKEVDWSDLDINTFVALYEFATTGNYQTLALSVRKRPRDAK